MKANELKGQLTLDMLFEKPKPDRTPPEKCIDWLVDIHGCPREKIASRVERIFAEFGRDAWDRAKAYAHLCGKAAIPGYDVTDDDWLGVFDHEIDYHTVWDRLWAARGGLPKKDVADLLFWDYTHQKPARWISN